LRAGAFLLRERPQVSIFQWWTGTVAHSYIILAFLARMLGARVVIEFHEVQDPGELRIRVARAYVRLVAPLLMRLASGFAVHTEADRALLEQRYALDDRPLVIMPHGPHDHYQACDTGEEGRVAPDSACNLLFFGLIRPYKGLQDLIAAFNSLSPEQASQFWLTIVGETWEGWTLPAELVAQSPYRERITFVNRYVGDAEVGKFFRAADAVILAYHRSCISGPLHVAMGYGLPVVVTRVGGLMETVEGYDGAILIPPQDSSALRDALVRVAALKGKRFTHPHTWDHTATTYTAFLSALMDSTDPCPEQIEEAHA
jgi:glycosyltransferase involved in cell wall biosynthesis